MGDRFFNMGHDLTTAHHAHHLHSTKKTFRYELQHKAEYTLDEALCPSCRYKCVWGQGWKLCFNYKSIMIAINNEKKKKRMIDRNIVDDHHNNHH